MARLFEASSRRISIDDLQQIALFQGVDPESLEELAGLFLEAKVSAQQIVLEENERADAFFIVSEGALAVYRDAPGAPVQLLARLHRDDFFGELGLVGEGGRYAASVRATEPSRVLRIGREDFLPFLKTHPEIQLKLQMVAARRHSSAVGAALEMGRRREVRIRCSREVVVELDDGQRRTMVLENLSLGGVCLGGAHDGWAEGSQVRFALVLREGLLELEGIVRWRRKDVVGISFNSKSPSHDMLLQMAIRLLLETGV